MCKKYIALISLQIAYARFGKPAHIMFCIVALFVNLIITANLILSGKAAIEVSVIVCLFV